MSDPAYSTHEWPLQQSRFHKEVLRRAVADRDRFLKQHPHLTAYQAEIDRLLDLSGDSHGRMTVLGTLMEGKLLEMKAQFERLNRHLHSSAVPAEPIAAPTIPAPSTKCCGQHCL